MGNNSANGAAAAKRTVLEWMVRAGISEERALEHLRDGWVRVDDELVTDPNYPTDASSHVDFRVIARAGA